MCTYHASYLGDGGEVLSVENLSKERLSFLTSKGELFIYSFQSDTLLFKEFIYEKKFKNIHSTMYFDDFYEILVINSSKNELLFYSVLENSFYKDKKVIKEISIICIQGDKKGKMIAVANNNGIGIIIYVNLRSTPARNRSKEINYPSTRSCKLLGR